MFFESIDGQKNYHKLIKLDPISFSFARILLPESLCSLLHSLHTCLRFHLLCLLCVKWPNPQRPLPVPVPIPPFRPFCPSPLRWSRWFVPAVCRLHLNSLRPTKPSSTPTPTSPGPLRYLDLGQKFVWPRPPISSSVKSPSSCGNPTGWTMRP